jgi:hypothetical protein
LAWESSSNSAAIYRNTWDLDNVKGPPKWGFLPSLEGRHVTDGFFILSLLLDCKRRNITLSVPHGGEQSKRFEKAIQERNDYIRLYGQLERKHCCGKCARVYRSPAEIHELHANIAKKLLTRRKS